MASRFGAIACRGFAAWNLQGPTLGSLPVGAEVALVSLAAVDAELPLTGRGAVTGASGSRWVVEHEADGGACAASVAGPGAGWAATA